MSERSPALFGEPEDIDTKIEKYLQLLQVKKNDIKRLLLQAKKNEASYEEVELQDHQTQRLKIRLDKLFRDYLMLKDPNDPDNKSKLSEYKKDASNTKRQLTQTFNTLYQVFGKKYVKTKTPEMSEVSSLASETSDDGNESEFDNPNEECNQNEHRNYATPNESSDSENENTLIQNSERHSNADVPVSTPLHPNKQRPNANISLSRISNTNPQNIVENEGETKNDTNLSNVQLQDENSQLRKKLSEKQKELEQLEQAARSLTKRITELHKAEKAASEKNKETLERLERLEEKYTLDIQELKEQHSSAISDINNIMSEKIQQISYKYEEQICALNRKINEMKNEAPRTTTYINNKINDHQETNFPTKEEMQSRVDEQLNFSEKATYKMIYKLYGYLPAKDTIIKEYNLFKETPDYMIIGEKSDLKTDKTARRESSKTTCTLDKPREKMESKRKDLQRAVFLNANSNVSLAGIPAERITSITEPVPDPNEYYDIPLTSVKPPSYIKRTKSTKQLSTSSDSSDESTYDDTGDESRRRNKKKQPATREANQPLSKFSFNQNTLSHPPPAWYMATFKKPWCIPPRIPANRDDKNCKIEISGIDKFDGNENKYVLWRNAVVSIIHQSPTNWSTKLMALIKVIDFSKPSLEAFFPHQNHSLEVYANLINQLERKFGGEKKLIRFHKNNLRKITAIKTVDVDLLEILLNKAVAYLNILREYDREEKILDEDFYDMVMEKLPRVLRIKFINSRHLKHTILNTNKSKALDVKDLLNWLSLEVEDLKLSSLHDYNEVTEKTTKKEKTKVNNALYANKLKDYSEMSNSDSEQEDTVLAAIKLKRKKKIKQNSNNSMNYTSKDAMHNERICTVCEKAGHTAPYCIKYRKMSPKERLELIKTKRLCFNCLEQHFVTKCKQGNRCKICKGKHDTYLHGANPSHRNPIKEAKALYGCEDDSSENESDVCKYDFSHYMEDESGNDSEMDENEDNYPEIINVATKNKKENKKD
jgi:hypothetical protein